MLYLAPMDVQMETHSAKEGFGTTCCRSIITSVLAVMKVVWPPDPCMAEGYRPNVGVTERVLLEMEGRSV